VPSSRERIADGLEKGTYRSALVEDALRWRTHRSDYALSTVVGYAVQDDLADAVHATLTDDEFRELRLSRFGAAALHEDLNAATEYFSRTRPDLLRYIRLLFQQRSAERGDDHAVRHRAHCRAFADFLQLDVPMAQRREIGLHRALHRLFPMTVAGDRVRLAGYELGTWRCRCGTRQGHDARYEFRCGCGTEAGNGRLSGDRRPCRRCGEPAAYTVCGQCGTRVTLDLWWRIQEGGVHPSECRVPLVLNLRFERSRYGSPDQVLSLLWLPVMLGLAERAGELIFDLPDMLWVSDVHDRYGQKRPTGHLVAIADHPRYNRQTDVTRILEAAFQLTFSEPRARYGSALEKVIARMVDLPVNGRGPRGAGWFTAMFARKAGYGLAGEQQDEADLARGADRSRPCVVGVSTQLRGDMALVSRELAAPGTLSGAGLDNVGVSLYLSRLGEDELTAEPPDVPAERCRALAPDGIVVPARTVEPGDVLVGISTPAVPGDLTPEERLLRAIFGEEAPSRRDASFRWAGPHPARILSVHVTTSRTDPLAFGEHRVVGQEQLEDGEIARISVSLAILEPLETGDPLYGPDGSRVVVCGSHDRDDADILVGSTHRWVEGEARTIEVRLRPGERSRSVATARATGPYALITGLPLATRAEPGGQPIRLVDLTWLLHHGASRAAFELYALRADNIDGRVRLFQLLAGGDASEWPPARPAPESPAALGTAPLEAVRNWDRLLRAVRIEAVWSDGGLSFRALDDDEVLAASSGEVRRPEMYHPTTWLPEPDGLYCQRVFGPVRDNVCGCGKRHSHRRDGETCAKCGVEVAEAKVRRHRSGHIELAAHVVHPWYLDHLRRALEPASDTLDDIIYGRRGVDRDSGALITPDEADPRTCSTGAEAVQRLLVRRGVTPPRGAFLRRVPVLTPHLRPAASLGRQSHIAELSKRYAEVLQQNAELQRLAGEWPGWSQTVQAHARLQEKVDSLFGTTEAVESLADLTTIMRGRERGFRDRLFERRPVDYSAQAILVAAPTGDLDRMRLPDRLAWVLLTPIVVGRLVAAGDSSNVKVARRAVQNRTPAAWAHLQAACRDATILVSVPGTRWPIFAARVEVTAELALTADPALLDHLGWSRLGASVRIFALMTAEAAAEARATLLPSSLLRQGGDPPAGPPPSLLSLGDRDLLAEIVRLAETGEPASLTDLDRFLIFPT
jgi:hypothetical protein